MALSIAGLWWGGTESFTLLAADCATARVEQIENWSPPTEHKIEARSKAPTTFLTWLRYAENSIKVFGSAYGLEHVQERNKFLQALREAHEEDENAFPFAYCVQLFEEMTAVWCEEIRESRRRLCAKLGTENPRLEDFKLVALSPSATGQANFQFPRVWDLADPAGYYQRVEAQKRKEAYERLLASKKLAPLAGCSDHLHSHVASHFVNAEMRGKVVQLSDILTQAIDYGHPQLAEEAQEVLSSIGVKAGLNLPEPEARFDTFVWTDGVGKGQMTFNHPLWEGVPPLDILDAQDKLTLPDDLRVALQLENEKAEEMRQCLCLHVALAFEGDLTTAWENARDLRRELWEESSAAFQHLGDASPYISTAEAFVRHNAHDCIYPDHEIKDFRVLQLFARRFMQGRLLVVIRLSHQGIVEIDTVRGEGALEAYGAVVIHRGHMRTAQCSTAQAKQLLEIATQGARVIRELEVDGWGSFLEAQDAVGDIIPSKPHPCYRCRRPQTPCKAGVEEDDAGDPARPSVEIGLCGGTAQPSPRQFSLFVQN